MPQTIIGVDIGGTKCAFGLYSLPTMKLLKSFQFPTNGARGFERVESEVIDAIQALRRTDTVAVGIAVQGFVEKGSGTIRMLPNIPHAEGVPLKRHLEKRLKIPVIVGNDSQGFALAEARDGAGKGKRVVIGVTMGTGLGGGIVIDGQLFDGAHGCAGEFGHMLLCPGDPPFETADVRGEVEQFLSGTAIRRRLQRTSAFDELLEGPRGVKLREKLIEELAWFIASLTHCIDPDIVVFGGGIGRSLSSSIPELKRELTRWLHPGVPPPRLAVRKLSDAATRGAAFIALEAIPAIHRGMSRVGPSAQTRERRTRRVKQR